MLTFLPNQSRLSENQNVLSHGILGLLQESC